MTTKQTGSTFDPDALWAKSRVFIDRALRARDHQEELEFPLWSAMALELIGKAALARISPALVADPNDFGSLFFACGGAEPADKKSIQAKTVFLRLMHAVPNFDEQMRKQCTTIASRRNAELHSGESPMAGLDQRAWVPVFWKCAATIIIGQGMTLEQWVGANEAARVDEILADASRLLASGVAARIERMKREYDERFPVDSLDRGAAQGRAAARAVPRRISIDADEVEEHDCPACDSKGWLLGYESGVDIDGPHEGEDDEAQDFFAYENVTTHYSADAFRCVECGLSIEGRAEMEIAGLPDEFVRHETREAQYEEEYGND
jgi:hypothetical protein